MEIINIEEFQKNQKHYLDKVDIGEDIIIQIGKDKAYKLTSFNLEEMYFNPTMIKRIQDSMKQIENGESKQISTKKEIEEYFGF